MTLTHCMVDLETLGVRSGSIILSIGAVMFDPVGGVIGDVHYDNITRASCEAAGLTAEPATEDWWSKQSPEARAALDTGAILLIDALALFDDFWRSRGAKYIWSHGANFDEVLLSAAYRAAGLTPPWKYYDVMCSRTVTVMTNIRPDRSLGVHHNALDDARTQARAIIEAYAVLGLSKCNACGVSPTATHLDGENLCQGCAIKWIKGEGAAAAEREAAEREAEGGEA